MNAIDRPRLPLMMNMNRFLFVLIYKVFSHDIYFYPSPMHFEGVGDFMRSRFGFFLLTGLKYLMNSCYHTDSVTCVD